MTWSYSGDPATSEKDRYRFLIGDTDETDPLLSDEEMNYLIECYGSNREMLLYQLYAAILPKVARIVTERLGPQSVSSSDIYKHYYALSLRYLNAVAGTSTPVMAVAHEAIFDINMHTNT